MNHNRGHNNLILLKLIFRESRNRDKRPSRPFTGPWLRRTTIGTYRGSLREYVLGPHIKRLQIIE